MEKIIMYGAGVEGEKWYAENHSKYDIQYVIDKKNNRKFHGIQVYSKEEKLNELKKYKIIVCTGSFQYLDIAKELKIYGFNEFEDFTWKEMLYDKKLMILYGNCHMGIIADYYRYNPNIYEKYTILYVPICIYKRIDEDWLLKCNIFITQDIRENNKEKVMGYEEILKNLKKDCKICIIPNLYGCNLFYPQIGGKFGDKIIEEMYEDGKKIEEIAEELNDEDLFERSFIVSEFNENLNKLRKREKKCDIEIVDFIEDNYKNVQLFYEPQHPTNVLLIEVSKRILKYLQIKDFNYVNPTYNLGHGEIFIYESVRKKLGLKYRQEFVKKDPSNWKYTRNNQPQSKLDYVKEYILNNFENE